MTDDKNVLGFFGKWVSATHSPVRKILSEGPTFDLVFPDEHGALSLVPKGDPGAIGYTMTMSDYAKHVGDHVHSGIEQDLGAQTFATNAVPTISPEKILEQIHGLKAEIGKYEAPDLVIEHEGKLFRLLYPTSISDPTDGPDQNMVTFNIKFETAPYEFHEFAVFRQRTAREVIRDQVRAHQRRKYKRAARARTGRR